ncbi:hypothetical protein B0H17DRAFT_1153468 [Mycena rosella]|uniref:Uncharacterized protein n=1 Tax=Mycena rosella TaxID=1033263 RepID=A0AAD7B761_MYCRO|nr:hypothetical protein B0H17DRAFT_1153468 [Mycena rosella]
MALRTKKAHPKRKPQLRKRVISDATLSDDSDANSEPPAKKKKHAKEVLMETEKVDLTKRKLLLNIPRALELGNQCVEFTHATPFSVALAVIHSTIGCTDFNRKPDLSYKLGNDTKAAPAMSLTSGINWKGSLDDVRQAENAKKAGTVIPVMIHVTDQYLASVAAKSGKNKAPTAKKGKKAPILDLDHAGTDDDDFDEDLGGMEKETKFMEQLDNMYGHCQACGPTKFCKITVASGKSEIL